LVIAGADHSKYTGYAFLDPGSLEHHFGEDRHGNEANGNEEDDDDDDSIDEERDDMENEPPEDHFVTDGRDRFLYADAPVWDPRIAFLRAAQIRIHLARQEYEYLVKHIEVYVGSWVSILQLSCTSSLIMSQIKVNMPSTSGSRKEVERDGPLKTDEEQHEIMFGWIAQTTQLLSQIQESLSATHEVWSRFDGFHGDIAYLSDLRDVVAITAIDGIRDAFADLARLRNRLVFVEKTCKEATRIVSYQFTSQSRDTHTQFSSKLELG
tara:strand:+ start:5818 stop:6615 length:798 start_codon:yes stop_codon:yes gene_type:complete